jgi:glycosyltransferase involved in cell wall biosynthesis
MRILNIIPGSGGSFYCGNCLRDSKYVDAMRALGHEVIKIPMYLPLFADEHDIKDIPVFYGAVSIYLKQLYPVFRKAPAWFDKLLNSGPVLRLAAGMAGSTRAKGLEEMTVSMLLGEEGKQKEELERMVDWMAANCHPEIIHLSNALLLGLTHKLKEKLNVPLVCSLQDEDVWVDVMQPAVRDKVWNLMHLKSDYVDLFVPVSDYYAKEMMQKMKLPGDKISVLHIGVDPSDYRVADVNTRKRNIGFLSRMCAGCGLDILVDAFIILKQNNGYEDVKLILTGGSTGDDTEFLKRLKGKLKKNDLLKDVIFREDFESEGRARFFDEILVLSVPVLTGEAFGIYILEAMASGIPVVQPATGAFPEIINKTGGGIIYQPNTPEKLAGELSALLGNRELIRKKSEAAEKGVREHFNIHKKAAEMVQLYQELVGNGLKSYVGGQKTVDGSADLLLKFK